MFRWKRALLHGLIPLGVVIAVGLVLLFVTHPVDPEKAGEGFGRLAFVAYLAGLGVSYLAQTGRKRAALFTSVGLVAAVGLIVAFAVSTVSSRGKPLRAIDREPLVEVDVAGKHRLRHPTFGFSILRPPASYTAQPALATMLSSLSGHDPNAVFYAYAETPPAAVVIVGSMTNLGSTRREFEDGMRGMRRGLESAGAAKMLRDEITGDDDHPVAHIETVVGRGHLRMEVQPLPDRSAAVAVMVIDADGTALTDVLTSLSFP